MSEQNLDRPESGRPWLSDDEVLMNIPCMPGREDEVIKFMRDLPVEHYVVAQDFFRRPTEVFADMVIRAYEDATNRSDETSAEAEEHLPFLEYLQTLEKMPSLEQFDGLCEEHGSYWDMVDGPQNDEVATMQLSYLKITLIGYREYKDGTRRIIPTPDTVFDCIERIEAENNPEAKREKAEQFDRVVIELLERLGPRTAALRVMLESLENA